MSRHPMRCHRLSARERQMLAAAYAPVIAFGCRADRHTNPAYASTPADRRLSDDSEPQSERAVVGGRVCLVG